MFEIVKEGQCWIMNEEGYILIRDCDTQSTLWVPKGAIKFNDQNFPVLKDSNILLERPEDEDDNGDSNDGEEDVNSNDITFPKTTENKEQSEVTGNGLGARHGRTLWQYDATMALISAVEDRYENLYRPKKKKTFWQEISEVLIGDEFYYDPSKCKKKWDNLLKTYKTSKDLNNKTGRGPTRFPFYDRLDNLLGDKPNNASPHTIDVAVTDETTNDASPIDMATPSVDKDEAVTKPINEPPKDCTNHKKRKRRTAAMELVELKTQQYEAKQYAADEKLTAYKRYLNTMEEVQAKKLALYERKLELEERKVQALEKLVPPS